MQLQSALVLLGLAATTAVAQSSSYPDCVQACITRRPTSSFCNGDETGSALDFCTCQSLSGSLLVSCIRECPEDEQSVYVGRAVPESCHESLFPGIEASEGSNASPTDSSDDAEETPAETTEETTEEAAPETTAPSDDAAPTTLSPVTTTSDDSAAEETASDASASSTSEDSASETAEESAGASESGDAEDDDNAAMGREIPALLAAGGLLAALLL